MGIRWMDRVLALLLELPGALLFQRSVLQLALFYADRSESDAFGLLHSPPQQKTLASDPPAAVVSSSTLTAGLTGLCPPGPNRLLVVVPQSIVATNLTHVHQSFTADATAWNIRWVVSAPTHVEALLSGAGRDGDMLIWRRFEAEDLDAFASAVCDSEPVWVANLSQIGDPRASAEVMQRLAVSPSLSDLDPATFPIGFWPVRPISHQTDWPSELLQAYLAEHRDFRRSITDGSHMGAFHPRLLIYTCTSMSYCGGHGDRLNGMLSAAIVAVLSGRLFFIDSQRPVPLALVLQPQEQLDWRLFGTHAAFPATLNFNDDLAGFKHDPWRALHHQARVLRFISNQRLTGLALKAAPRQAEAFGLASHPKLHSQLFHMLFAPSPALRRRLAARSLPDGQLIGVHFRAGDQMPHHWKDPPRHDLGELDGFLDCAFKLEQSLGWSARMLLFADTDRVLQHPRVSQLLEQGKLLWPARDDALVHLDRSPATLTVRGLLGVWADWWTLAFDVHALVLGHSGFGATAMEIGPPRPAALGKGCVLAEAGTG